jgi:hypothetical protein
VVRRVQPAVADFAHLKPVASVRSAKHTGKHRSQPRTQAATDVQS